jgi:hypothetical protein
LNISAQSTTGLAHSRLLRGALTSSVKLPGIPAPTPFAVGLLVVRTRPLHGITKFAT